MMKDSKSLKKSKELFKVIVINLVFLLIFVELGSLGFYFTDKKDFFYTRKNNSEKEEAKVGNIRFDETRLDESILQRIHPYFGYIVKPGIPFALEFSKTAHKVNNYGFVSDSNYPVFKENKNQFIVGVFGGSVANNYAVYEIENNILINQLKKLPYFANKEIIILPFASGGYKQPQQLLMLNYFLSLGQEFDMVINIDGFNEVAISNLNNQDKIELSMPSVQHILPLQDFANNSFSTEELSAIAQIEQYKKQLKKALKESNNCWLASCYLFKSLAAQSLLKSYQREIGNFDKLRKNKSGDGYSLRHGSANASAQSLRDSLININKIDSVLPDSVAYEKMANLWANSSSLMKQILSSKNSLYFQFIQPNQYYPTKRIFSKEEQKIAILENNPYVDGVKKGYPVILEKQSELNKSQVNIFNGVKIFDDVKDIVYIDTCCHYNKTGSDIFSNYVAGSIVEVLSKDAKFTRRSN